MRMASLIVEMITNTRCIIIISIISNILKSCNNGSIKYSPCLKDNPRLLFNYFGIRIINSILQLEKRIRAILVSHKLEPLCPTELTPTELALDKQWQQIFKVIIILKVLRRMNKDLAASPDISCNIIHSTKRLIQMTRF